MFRTGILISFKRTAKLLVINKPTADNIAASKEFTEWSNQQKSIIFKKTLRKINKIYEKLVLINGTLITDKFQLVGAFNNYFSLTGNQNNQNLPQSNKHFT